MGEEKLKSLKVKIAGRDYPMKVSESELKSIEKIADEINKQIKDFQLQYHNRDLQDCIVMTLLNYAVDAYHLSEDGNANGGQEPKNVDKKLSTINTLLDSMLLS